MTVRFIGKIKLGETISIEDVKSAQSKLTLKGCNDFTLTVREYSHSWGYSHAIYLNGYFRNDK